MFAKRHRLDRFISSRTGFSLSDVRLLIAQKRITLDSVPAEAINQVIHQFTRVVLDGEIIQDETPKYVMLNKPEGVVCATKDKQHTTVIDLLDLPYKNQLHIAGRLDFNSTGLVLLTNDGGWSQSLQQPATKVAKCYRVTLRDAVTEDERRQDYIRDFNEGFYFSFEDITTLPAGLSFIDDHITEVILTEGRYHQIKRMFGRFQNKVTALHRHSVGKLTLDPSLAPGQSRELTPREVRDIDSKP